MGESAEAPPEAGGVRRYCEALKDRGLLCKETHSHTLRIMPPLIVTREQLDEAMVEFRAVLAGYPVLFGCRNSETCSRK